MPGIEFTVDGVPPIKRGSQSMWGRQVGRVRSLRRAAASKSHTPASLEEVVHLRIVVYAQVSDGDLDGFVAGICDGLQPAPANVVRYLREEEWADLPEAARPELALGFTDDRSIARIEAERRAPAEGHRYHVSLTW